MGTLALIETLDRDGSVRQSHKVQAWPVRVGRSLDNDIVLDDPHVAAFHFTVDANEDHGVFVAVGDTVNGLSVGAQRLAAGERWHVGGRPADITAGRTQLNLRLAEHALAPEKALTASRVFAQSPGVLLWLVLLNLLSVGFTTYLATDPELLPRTLASNGMMLAAIVLVWCGAWTLLSKLFTRRGHFGWHLRVMLTAMLALELLGFVASLLGFALSWDWLTAYDYLPEMAIAAFALYLHLQAVEPHRHRFTRGFAVGALIMGLGISAWRHWQDHESLASELYMTALYPPMFRIADGVSAESFVERLGPFEKALDEKAAEPTDPDEEDEEAEAEAEAQP